MMRTDTADRKLLLYLEPIDTRTPTSLIQIKRPNWNLISLTSAIDGRTPIGRKLGFFHMPEAASYSALEHLRSGRTINIRALRPDDTPAMLAAIEQTSMQSLQRRFFVTKRSFSEKEIDYFINVDFDKHVALVAQIDDDGKSAIAGGGRYIVVGPGQAEIAFVVVDAYQGQGIGTILMRHLAVLARQAGLKELIAEVLPQNAAMLKLFRNFGFQSGPGRDPQVRHLSLQLA